MSSTIIIAMATSPVIVITTYAGYRTPMRIQAERPSASDIILYNLQGFSNNLLHLLTDFYSVDTIAGEGGP